MTEAEALDMAAKAAGWDDFADFTTYYHVDDLKSIRAHAKTIVAMAELMTDCEEATTRMELMYLQHQKVVDDNAALKAENERLRAIVKDAHSILSECKVTFGVCACGEDMETHGESHTPMDQAQVAVNRWFEAASAALKEIDNGDR